MQQHLKLRWQIPAELTLSCFSLTLICLFILGTSAGIEQWDPAVICFLINLNSILEPNIHCFIPRILSPPFLSCHPFTKRKAWPFVVILVHLCAKSHPSIQRVESKTFFRPSNPAGGGWLTQPNQGEGGATKGSSEVGPPMCAYRQGRGVASEVW